MGDIYSRFSDYQEGSQYSGNLSIFELFKEVQNDKNSSNYYSVLSNQKLSERPGSFQRTRYIRKQEVTEKAFLCTNYIQSIGGLQSPQRLQFLQRIKEILY